MCEAGAHFTKGLRQWPPPTLDVASTTSRVGRSSSLVRFAARWALRGCWFRVDGFDPARAHDRQADTGGPRARPSATAHIERTSARHSRPLASPRLISVPIPVFFSFLWVPVS